MDTAMRDYLDKSFEMVNTKIDGINKTLLATIEPIEKDVSRLRADVSDLYEKDRAKTTVCETHRNRAGERVGEIENYVSVKKIEDSRRRWGAEQIIVVCLALLMTGVTIWIGIK